LRVWAPCRIKTDAIHQLFSPRFNAPRHVFLILGAVVAKLK
jgi:hypothetical protein